MCEFCSTCPTDRPISSPLPSLPSRCTAEPLYTVVLSYVAASLHGCIQTGRCSARGERGGGDGCKLGLFARWPAPLVASASDEWIHRRRRGVPNPSQSSGRKDRRTGDRPSDGGASAYASAGWANNSALFVLRWTDHRQHARVCRITESMIV